MTNRIMWTPDGLDNTSEATVTAGLGYYGFTVVDGGANSTFSAPTATGAMKKLQLAWTGSTAASVAVPISGTPPATVFFGVRLTLSVLNATDVILFRDNATSHLGVKFNADGSCTVTRYASTALVTTSAGQVTAGSEFYLEGEITISDTVGVVKLYLNGSGTPFVNLTSQDTRNSANAQITNLLFFSSSTTLVTYALRDLYVNDSAGSYNNTIWGDTRIQRLVPNSNAASGFTPSTGSDNAALVGKTPMGIASYVGSAVATTVDRYGLTNLDASPASIHAVRTMALLAKTDAGTREGRSFIKSNGTTSNGAAVAPSTSPLIYSDLFERDPDGTAAWTESAVNALECGVEVTT